MNVFWCHDFEWYFVYLYIIIYLIEWCLYKMYCNESVCNIQSFSFVFQRCSLFQGISIISNKINEWYSKYITYLSCLSCFFMHINLFIVNMLIFTLLWIIVVFDNNQYIINNKYNKNIAHITFNIHAKRIDLIWCPFKENDDWNIGWTLDHYKSIL